MKESVKSSFPRYGHFGIREAARELFMQVDGNPRDDSEYTVNNNVKLS